MTDNTENHPIPDSVPTVSMQVVQILLQYAREKKIDLEGIPLKVYLTQNNLEARLPAADFNQLWEEISKRAGDTDFGLHFGEESFSFPAGNLLLSVLMNCLTLEEALLKLSRYHGLIADNILLHLERGVEISHFFLDPAWKREKVSQQHSEAMMASLRRLIHGLTAQNVKPTVVEFQHPQPEDTSEHQRIFGCPLRFDQPYNRLLLNTADLDYKIFLAKPAMLKEFEQISQELVDRLYTADTWGKRVARILSQLLINGGKVNLEKVASETSISRRNLQSRLHEENISYREILEELRKELALRYLTRSDVSIYEIAFLLGYSEQNTFTRAFKRWTELHPAQYQQESLLD